MNDDDNNTIAIDNPDSEPQISAKSKRKKEERRAAAKNRKKEKAAILIQSQFRGHSIRKASSPNRQLIPETTAADNEDGEDIQGLLVVQLFRVESASQLQTTNAFVRISFQNEVDETEPVKFIASSSRHENTHELNVEAVFEISNTSQLTNEFVNLELIECGETRDESPVSLGVQKVKLVGNDIHNQILENQAVEFKPSYTLVTLLRFENGTTNLNPDISDEDEVCCDAKVPDQEMEQEEEVSEEEEDFCVWPQVFSKEPSEGWPSIASNEPLSTLASVRAFVTTWNLQAKKPPEDLGKFLKPGCFHLYAIGTEECVNSIAKSMIFKSKKEWEERLQRCLGPDYIMICSHGLQAIHNIVYVHKALLPCISNVKSSAIPTGLLNQLGNKGGVGISLSIKQTSFLFVSCHFEAHQGSVRKRNSNFQKINSDLNFGTNDASKSFDRVFWSGDFNYRINGNRKMIDQLLKKDMYKVLLANDQLGIEKKEGRVFEGFSEGPLHFRPTYKFDRGTDNYDTSEKRRIPSWTDRIMYRNNGKMEGNDEHSSDIQLLCYDSCSSIKTSDHRPVFAVFDVHIQPSGPESAAAEETNSVVTNQSRSEVCCVQ